MKNFTDYCEKMNHYTVTYNQKIPIQALMLSTMSPEEVEEWSLNTFQHAQMYTQLRIYSV